MPLSMRRRPALSTVTYRNYLLVILLLIQAYSYVDGWVLGLVLQDIKADLHLSDTQLGFLTGIAFWIFYSCMGIPIARWADRGNRVTIIAVALVAWSVMVSLCAVARSFFQLALIRVGVAVGEAGCVPPAHSLIADYFTRGERPRAVAVYMLGGPVSMIIGYFCGGWLNQLYGWRSTFLFVGIPGVLLSGIARFTLKEPRCEGPSLTGGAERRSCREQLVDKATVKVTLKEVAVTLFGNRTFRHLLMAFSIVSFFVSGITQWQPAFFVRSYGMKTGELGGWFALIYGLGGLIGTYGCGAWASRRAANNERLQLAVVALMTLAFGVFSALVYVPVGRYLAFASMAMAAVGGAAVNGPVFATIQTLVPEHMRATSIAIIYFFCNLIGTGLGPLAVGALSDLLRQWAGEESLRYALLILCPGYLWGGWHLWLASRTVTRDLESSRMAVGPLQGDSGG